MTEYQEYLQERDMIDFFIQKGYKITVISEDLDGALVSFEKQEKTSEQTQSETLRISNANARKYFAVRLIQQNAFQA